MKPKEQKQLEAQYRNVRHRVRRLQDYLERLQAERDVFDKLPSWRKEERNKTEADLEVAEAAMLDLDTKLRAKGYWYNGTTEIQANHR